MTNRTAHVIGIVIVWAFALCFGWFYASGVCISGLWLSSAQDSHRE